jgi:hypothetical protein
MNFCKPITSVSPVLSKSSRAFSKETSNEMIQNRKLQAANKAIAQQAEADTARLDWLQKFKEISIMWADDRYELEVNPPAISDEGFTLRAAIDAARKEDENSTAETRD